MIVAAASTGMSNSVDSGRYCGIKLPLVVSVASTSILPVFVG